jgi:hypothetical protein
MRSKAGRYSDCSWGGLCCCNCCSGNCCHCGWGLVVVVTGNSSFRILQNLQPKPLFTIFSIFLHVLSFRRIKVQVVTSFWCYCFISGRRKSRRKSLVENKRAGGFVFVVVVVTRWGIYEDEDDVDYKELCFKMSMTLMLIWIFSITSFSCGGKHTRALFFLPPLLGRWFFTSNAKSSLSTSAVFGFALRFDNATGWLQSAVKIRVSPLEQPLAFLLREKMQFLSKGTKFFGWGRIERCHQVGGRRGWCRLVIANQTDGWVVAAGRSRMAPVGHRKEERSNAKTLWLDDRDKKEKALMYVLTDIIK